MLFVSAAIAISHFKCSETMPQQINLGVIKVIEELKKKLSKIPSWDSTTISTKVSIRTTTKIFFSPTVLLSKLCARKISETALLIEVTGMLGKEWISVTCLWTHLAVQPCENTALISKNIIEAILQYLHNEINSKELWYSHSEVIDLSKIITVSYTFEV